MLQKYLALDLCNIIKQVGSHQIWCQCISQVNTQFRADFGCPCNRKDFSVSDCKHKQKHVNRRHLNGYQPTSFAFILNFRLHWHHSMIVPKYYFWSNPSSRNCHFSALAFSNNSKLQYSVYK